MRRLTRPRSCRNILDERDCYYVASRIVLCGVLVYTLAGASVALTALAVEPATLGPHVGAPTVVVCVYEACGFVCGVGELLGWYGAECTCAARGL